MTVRVQFYAQLRDAAGRSYSDVDLADGANVSDLLKNLYAKFPALGEHDKSILVGAGVEFVDRNYQLKGGEEISVMPPVQGG
jgi:MoaD family protein